MAQTYHAKKCNAHLVTNTTQGKYELGWTGKTGWLSQLRSHPLVAQLRESFVVSIRASNCFEKSDVSWTVAWCFS